MECVPGPWVLAAGEMGRILLTEGSSKGYSLGYGHLCMCNNYESISCFSISPHRYGHLCMCNSYWGGEGVSVAFGYKGVVRDNLHNSMVYT